MDLLFKYRSTFIEIRREGLKQFLIFKLLRGHTNHIFIFGKFACF